MTVAEARSELATQPSLARFQLQFRRGNVVLPDNTVLDDDPVAVVPIVRVRIARRELAVDAAQM
jgi:hypothetical protein